MRLDGFVNVDARRTGATDLVHLCRDLSPFDTESVDVVFANAFFEHLHAADRLPFLREVHRVLSPGGTVYLTGIPDFEGVARAYLDRRKGHVSARFDVDDAYRYTHGFPEQAPAWWLEQLHKSLTDREKLLAFVSEAGFGEWFVFRYAWGEEPNAVNLGLLAQKRGSRPLDRATADRVTHFFAPVTNVNRNTVEVVAASF
jgi:predicted SAM-dependent methyltransferase